MMFNYRGQWAREGIQRIQRSDMKPEIHPEYKDTVFTCACGSTFTTRSTVKGDVHTDICSACHPFFTGKEKLVDSAGRIEKFNRRYNRAPAGK